MPMNYTIDSKRGVILITGRARLTNDEMVECVARLRADSRVLPGMPTISDMRDVTELAVDHAGMVATGEVMAKSRETRGTAKVAIVVRNKGDEMMAKLLQAMGHKANPEVEIKAFDNYRNAELWLGLAKET